MSIVHLIFKQKAVFNIPTSSMQGKCKLLNINPRPTNFVCLLLGQSGLDPPDTSLTGLPYFKQHSSFINSFVYDCKLTFSLVERMVVLDYCFYLPYPLWTHMCY